MDEALKTSGTALRRRVAAPWRGAVAAALLVATAAVSAQQGNRDYYSARQTKTDAELLKNVEKYHIDPGIAKMQAGSYGNALQDFEFILRYYPNHPRGLALISELCDVKWKNERCDSDTWFRRAADLNAQAFQTFLVYGVHLQRLNRLPEAVEKYQKALALDPVSGNAHYNLGLVYVEQKQYDLANLHAQQAYALGMPFPGLRDKLQRAGQWKPMDPEELKRRLAPPDKAPAAAASK